MTLPHSTFLIIAMATAKARLDQLDSINQCLIVLFLL